MKNRPEAARTISMETEFRSATSMIAQQRKDGIDTLRKLSASGYPPASYELGNCLYIGNLIERDQFKAVGKWREAAYTGYIIARLNLIKYEWHFATYFGKVILILRSIATILWASWLIMMDDGHDIRLMGNTNPSLRI